VRTFDNRVFAAHRSSSSSAHVEAGHRAGGREVDCVRGQLVRLALGWVIDGSLPITTMFPLTTGDQVALLAWAAVSVGSGVSWQVGSAETMGAVIANCACSHPRPCVRVRHGHVVAAQPRSVASLSGEPNREGRR